MAEIVLAERLAALQESATLALNARAQQLKAEGRTIYNLTAGELASDTPEFIQTAVAKTLHHNKYTAVAGLPELRELIAQESRTYYGLDWIKPANVVVTGAVKPSLYTMLLALINPGDEVIVPTPMWVTYRQVIELVGGVVVAVPLTADYDLDPVAIAGQLSKRTKAILINSPHNPTGAVFSNLALTKLARLLRGQAISVISDDIYSKLIFDADFTLVPTCGFEHLVIINGFSKSQALTGWRIGYCIAAAPLAKAVSSILSHTSGNASLPAQYAGLAAMERHDQPPAKTLATLQRQRQLVAQALDELPQLAYHLPGGAFYFFIDLRGVTDDSAAWCERLLNATGVALVPGEAFDAPGFARLTFVTEEATLTAALQQLQAFVKQGDQQ